VVAAHLYVEENDLEHALWLHAAADVVLERVGMILFEGDRARRQELRERALLALGDQRFANVEAAGRSADREMAADLAAEELRRVAAREGRGR
jgi:hypothetical protein